MFFIHNWRTLINIIDKYVFIIFWHLMGKVIVSLCGTDRYADMKIFKIFCSWKVSCILDWNLEIVVVLANQRLSCQAKRCRDLSFWVLGPPSILPLNILLTLLQVFHVNRYLLLDEVIFENSLNGLCYHHTSNEVFWDNFCSTENKFCVKDLITISQFPVDMVTFPEKILDGKLHFLCSVC